MKRKVIWNINMNHLTNSFSVAFFISGHRHQRGNYYGRLFSTTSTCWEWTNKVLPGRSHHHSYQQSSVFCEAHERSWQLWWWTKSQKNEGIQRVQEWWKSRDIQRTLQSGIRQSFLKTQSAWSISHMCISEQQMLLYLNGTPVA